MREQQREITSVKITVTLELSDLGTFGSGSLFAQAQQSAAIRLGEMLGIDVDPRHLTVESISSTNKATGSSYTEELSPRRQSIKLRGK